MSIDVLHTEVMSTATDPRAAIVGGSEPVETAPCCVPSGSAPMDAARAVSLSRQFKAIADPNRLRLVSLVSASPGSEACVCDLTEPLDLGQPTVSHHLKILVDAGILRREKRGVWAYYSLVPGALDALADVLMTRTGTGR
ncbi:ArsR family transcriptional regulator [Arthrobacter sp. PL16]|nr:ArsR family transcriptional regulator [Arthrobacter sp. PL16]